jgi:uncharacterized RmlC-like cupin family protein
VTRYTADILEPVFLADGNLSEHLEYGVEAGVGDFIYIRRYVPHHKINPLVHRALGMLVTLSDNEAA